MLPRLETDPDEEFTGAEIRDLTARVASSHRTAAPGKAVEDVVALVTAVAIAVGLVVGAAGVARDLLVLTPVSSTAPELPLATLRVLLLVAAAALGTSLAARLGPLSVSGAGLGWWLPMPVDRRSLLAPRLAQGLVLWAVGGACVVMLVTSSTGVPLSGQNLAVSAASGAVVGAFVVALVGLAQHRRAVIALTGMVSDLVLALTPVLGVVLLATGTTGTLSNDVGWGRWWGGGERPAAVALTVVTAGVAVVAATTWRWHRSLEGLGALALTPATAAAGQAATAVVSLDVRELARALDRPGAARPPRHVNDQRWVRGPVTALLSTEIVAVVRNPMVFAQLLGLGALVTLTRAVPALTGNVGQALVLLVVGVRSAQIAAQGARAAEVSPVIDSLLPLSARSTRLARAVVPAVAAFVSLLIGYSPQVAADPRWIALLAAAAGCFGAGAVRGAYRPPPTWSAPLLATPAGAVPTGALSLVTRGADAAALGALPIFVAVLAGSPDWRIIWAQLLFSAAALAVASSVRRAG